jgi:hypothetical protein
MVLHNKAAYIKHCAASGTGFPEFMMEAPLLLEAVLIRLIESEEQECTEAL